MKTPNNPEKRIPPKPPITAASLMTEMFGVLDSCPALYQGMLRYWLMWRLPEITTCIKNREGLKFHLCGTYQGLIKNILKLFLIPNFLTVGQCGPILQFEMLQYEHPFGQKWPRTDGGKSALGVISCKVDRPIVDGVVNIVNEWIRPLTKSNSILFAPFTTMLGPEIPIQSRIEVNEIVYNALQNASESGLSGKELSEALQEIGKNFNPSERVPLDQAIQSVGGSLLGEFNLSEMELEYGRYFYPGASISIPDPLWTPRDTLNFEFLIAQSLGSMLVVVGDWCNIVPDPRYELKLEIPYIANKTPRQVMNSIIEEEDAFFIFRQTISNALNEVLENRGSEKFSKELKHIQKDIIDQGLEKLNRKYSEIKKLRLTRYGEYVTGTLALSIGVYSAYSPAALSALIGGSISSVFIELGKRIVEKGEFKNEPMYFIWKIGR